MTNVDMTGSATADDYTMHWMGLFRGVLGSYQQRRLTSPSTGTAFGTELRDEHQQMHQIHGVQCM